MDVQTISNIVLSSLSLILVVISLITVYVSLKQNKKLISQNNTMIQNAIRPFISIYIDSITICEQQSYLVLKNFGASPATITKFSYDAILKETTQQHPIHQEQFDFVAGITLAPGQNKLLKYDLTTIEKDSLFFEIEYASQSGELFTERVTLTPRNYIHIPIDRPGSTDEPIIEKSANRLAHSMREIIQRLM